MDQVGTMLSQIKVSKLDGRNVTSVVQSVTMSQRSSSSCSDTGSPDQRGHTALAWAVVAGQEEAVKLLLAADKLGALFSFMFSYLMLI